ncbi:mitochondrial 54S ribosomal protein rml2 [Knufia obscura]|uniref:Mitochondrial 54S ribosomal protein rml2 n=1 Tax=Knufia obscura TaxID=1635080 RepID=A0ABR0S3T5_9EURO|nr:mitochondrial 54S ribosomal protein rml2 [Knufia obscura]
MRSSHHYRQQHLACRILDKCYNPGYPFAGYAQVVDPIAPSRTQEDAVLPTALPQSTALQRKTNSALRRYTPRTPGLRHLIRPQNDHLWKGRPVHALTFPKKGHARGGRNRTGRITVRHRGGGHKRRIRTVDFDRSAPGQHYVERIEHDPNRSAHIALVRDAKTGKQSYILAAEGMRAGDVVTSYRAGLPKELLKDMGDSVDMGVIASKTAMRGNCLKLGMIPVGTPIFNIAPNKDSYGKFARSAGTHGIIIGKGEDVVQKEMVKAMGDTGTLDIASLSQEQLIKFEKAANYVTVKLSSGEIRLIDKDAIATIGVASNANYKYTSLGKAGRKRWLGIRPTVRGTAMNTVDHPHGGGRGKSKGDKVPVSPWGVPTKSGYKTRPKHKINRLVVQERPRNQGKRRRGYA